MMTVVYGAMKNLACHFKPLAHTVRIQPHFRAVRSQLTLKTKNKQINKQRKHSNIKIIRLWVISPLHELLASNSRFTTPVHQRAGSRTLQAPCTEEKALPLSRSVTENWTSRWVHWLSSPAGLWEHPSKLCLDIEMCSLHINLNLRYAEITIRSVGVWSNLRRYNETSLTLASMLAELTLAAVSWFCSGVFLVRMSRARRHWFSQFVKITLSLSSHAFKRVL